MGTTASEISTDARMNSEGVRESASMNRNCEAPRPIYRISMYTASSAPRLALVVCPFSQLSATT